MRITMVAFGTRGEVQPYIALGLGLQAAGHTVKIVTIGQLHELVSAYKLTSVEIPFHSFSASQVNKKDSIPLRVMYQTAQQFIKQSLTVIWEACKDAEAIIFHHMSRMAVTHVVEKLQVPAFMVVIHPYHLRFLVYNWREINPHGEPVFELGGVLRQQAEWWMFKGHINRWRREVLGLPRAPFWGNDELIKRLRIPLFCAYSPAVYPKRADWPDWLHVTGYYFLERLQDWQPPAGLQAFLEDGPPPVFVGFSSSIHQGVQQATDVVVQALSAVGQRGILAAGWSEFGRKPDLPVSVFPVESVPHDWIFPRVVAAVHHAGAGTLGACIRAGIPSVAIPFSWDQPFWGQRVADLGIGPAPISPKLLTAKRLAAAIDVAVHDQTIRARATQLGEQIRAEDGIEQTLALMEQYLKREYNL
ncbi:MAG: glycosyltransferase family 1 protein [Anaerolineae bacterium]|nr:glycosyltransferase family 1 protein [Anaerolineae bacterium]